MSCGVFCFYEHVLGARKNQISKLKYDISQLRKDETKIYEKLGRLVFEKTQHNNMANFTGNTEFFSFVEEVNSVSADVTEKEIEITSIKKEYGIDDSDLEMSSDIQNSRPSQEEE